MASSTLSRKLYPARQQFIYEEDPKESDLITLRTLKCSQSKTPSGSSGRLYPAKEQFVSKEDLVETERLLQELKCSEFSAAPHYKAWVEQREKSIESIGDLEKKLRNLHRACNAAHGAGAFMEVIGGVALIAGTIITACGHKAVGEFLTKKVSTVTAGAGIATTVSSSVAEIELTRQTMKKTKLVLEKDEKFTKLLMGNLTHVKKIDSYVRRIFSCSVLSNIFLHVVRLCQEGLSVLNVGVVETSKLMDELKRISLKGAHLSGCTETAIQNACTTLKKISTDRKAREAVSNICAIIQRSPSSIEFIKLGLRISVQVCDVLKVDIISAVLGFSILKTSSGVMATKSLLGTVVVAANVLSVISAIQDAKENKSEYSEMLKELKVALAMELDAVRNHYSKLS